MDKVQKIREEVARLQKRAEHNFGISLTENERQFWLGESNVLTLIGNYIDTMQEEPVNEDLEEAAHEYADLRMSNYETAFYAFMSGAKWQKAKDQETIELAEDHAMLAGMEKMKEEMMKDAVGGYVIEDTEEGNGDFLLSAEYIPASMGLKDRQKVKVIILKDE